MEQSASSAIVSPEQPVEQMTLEQIQDELRRVTGTPWKTEADGPRRQALWRRLDQLVRTRGPLNGSGAPISG
jgi:hypothetical protein